MTRHRDRRGARPVRAAGPLLAHAASQIGYPAIRVRGTIGGSLAHADPGCGAARAWRVALGAELVLAGAGRPPTVAAARVLPGLLHDRDRSRASCWSRCASRTSPARPAGASPSWRARPATTRRRPSRRRHGARTARSRRRGSGSPASRDRPCGRRRGGRAPAARRPTRDRPPRRSRRDREPAAADAACATRGSASHVAGVLGRRAAHRRARGAGSAHDARARSRCTINGEPHAARPSRASCCPTSSARTSA